MDERSLSNHFVDDQSSKADHGQAPIPALRSCIEWAEAPGVGRFSVHYGHHRGVRDELDSCDEEDQTGGGWSDDLLHNCQPRELLGAEGPHEPEHCLQQP